METYNQLLKKYSRMGCIRYGIGHIMLLKYGLFVTNNYLLKSLEVFERLGVRSLVKGGSFSKFYESYVNQVNNKLLIKLKVVTKPINSILGNDTGTYGIGIIKYHSFGPLIDDGLLTKDEIDLFIKNDGVGHHITWDGSKGGYLVNSDGSNPVKCPLPVLKYMVFSGMTREYARTIEHADDRTKEILHLTLYMQKSEQKGKLNEFLDTNKDNIYLDQAKSLYYHGRNV